MSKTHGIAVLALLAGATAAVVGPPLTRDEALKRMAQPGTWVEADGTLLPDGSLLAKDLEVHTPADTVDRDLAIYGGVQNLNRAKSTMRVLGYAVSWDETTTLKDENKRKILSSKIERIGVDPNTLDFAN